MEKAVRTPFGRRLGGVMIAGGALVLLWSVPATGRASAPNHQDVWVDTAGDTGSNGHETDPHLPCADIAIFGSGLAQATNGYVIDGIQPSGSGHGSDQVWSGTWTYDLGTGGTQLLATINVVTLEANATGNGDTAAHQGFHFKLEWSQRPVKHKTFWVAACTATTPTPTPTATPTATPTGTPTPAATPTPSGGVLGTSATPTPSPTPASGVLALHTPSTGAGLQTVPLGTGLGLIGLGTLLAAMPRRREVRVQETR